MRNKCFEWHFIDIQCDAVKWRSVSIDVRLIEHPFYTLYIRGDFVKVYMQNSYFEFGIRYC